MNFWSQDRRNKAFFVGLGVVSLLVLVLLHIQGSRIIRQNEVVYRLTIYEYDLKSSIFQPKQEFLVPARHLRVADSETFKLVFTAEGKDFSGSGHVFRIERLP